MYSDPEGLFAPAIAAGVRACLANPICRSIAIDIAKRTGKALADAAQAAIESWNGATPAPPVCPPASAPGAAGDSNTVERQGPIPGAEAEEEENRCKEVLKTCGEICHLDGEVIGTGSDTLGEYRKCVRLCMEEAQCYNF